MVREGIVLHGMTIHLHTLVSCSCCNEYRRRDLNSQTFILIHGGGCGSMIKVPEGSEDFRGESTFFPFPAFSARRWFHALWAIPTEHGTQM